MKRLVVVLVVLIIVVAGGWLGFKKGYNFEYFKSRILGRIEVETAVEGMKFKIGSYRELNQFLVDKGVWQKGIKKVKIIYSFEEQEYFREKFQGMIVGSAGFEEGSGGELNIVLQSNRFLWTQYEHRESFDRSWHVENLFINVVNRWLEGKSVDTDAERDDYRLRDYFFNLND